MTTRADVNRLNAATQKAVRHAVSELERMWLRLRGESPETIRDAFLELVPVLIDKYGAVAGTAAAEWYEFVRAGQVRGRYAAAVAAGIDPSTAQGSVRFAAGHLFTENPQATVAVLAGTLQRQITNQARRTVIDNVYRDPARPGWARVPQGAKTCAFCLMLASRGFAYHSRETAGELNHYHDGCDCMAVPSWASKPEIAGYDPARLESMYLEARNAANSGDPKAIAQSLRALYPDAVTDGHVHDLTT